MAKKNGKKDALEVLREMSVINDHFQKNMRTMRTKAMDLIEKEHPVEAMVGGEFEHKGKRYTITITKAIHVLRTEEEKHALDKIEWVCAEDRMEQEMSQHREC